MTLKRPGAAQHEVRREQPNAPARPQRVWAIGGGKGGIGKTFLSTNIATVAARTGRRVVLVDADLGGANVHTCLGVRTQARLDLADFFQDRVVDLEKAAIDTPVPGLRLVVGALSSAGTAQTSREQRDALMSALRRMNADVVILDLASGMDRSTLDFFLEADEHCVVTTPEPTSIENAYGFMRAAFFRRLGRLMHDSPVRDLIRESMDQRNDRGIRTPADLLREIERHDSSEGARFRKVIAGFTSRLFLNQVRNSEEIKMGFSIRSVYKKFFGIDLDYTGYVNYDDYVWRSVKERRPLVLAYPQSDGALYIRRIVKKMLEG